MVYSYLRGQPKMSIPVYQAEIKDGLADTIKSNASIAYDCQLVPSDDIVFELQNFSHPEFASAKENDQWDLYPFDSILVSVGWNKNDDVFDGGEVFTARRTPVNKQVNFMHNEKDIIGHMIDSIILDQTTGKRIDNLDVVPDSFDIAVASVLYRKWDDPQLQERMDKIIAGIPNGEWFVSMECLFRNFDYALINQATGERAVVARSASSAFLTKHLRAYGGEGVYEGFKIGRLLRNFVFSGKGIVNNPANPRSIIFNQNNPFTATYSSLQIQESKSMSGTTVTNDGVLAAKLQDELNIAKAEKAKLESKLESLVAEAQKAEKEKFESEIASLKVDIADLEKDIAAKKEDMKKKDEDYKAMKEKADSLESENTTLKAELATLKTEKVKSERIAKLAEVGVTGDKASALVDRWASVSDEQFADVVELQKGKTSASTDVTVDPNDTTASTKVEEVEVEEETSVVASVTEESSDELQSAVASYFGSIFAETDSK